MAFSVSFFGNALLTFRTERPLKIAASRYIFVSIYSLCATSIILGFVRYHQLDIYIYIIIVIATVPTSTFLLAKLWAFKSENNNAPNM